jgi:YD repeat-containing protein
MKQILLQLWLLLIVAHAQAQQTYTHNTFDQITNAGWIYDANGNLTQIPAIANQPATSFRYDTANRLVESSSANKVVRYRYDGVGNLVGVGTGANATSIIWRELTPNEASALPETLSE